MEMSSLNVRYNINDSFGVYLLILCSHVILLTEVNGLISTRVQITSVLLSLLWILIYGHYLHIQVVLLGCKTVTTLRVI